MNFFQAIKSTLWIQFQVGNNICTQLEGQNKCVYKNKIEDFLFSKINSKWVLHDWQISIKIPV